MTFSDTVRLSTEGLEYVLRAGNGLHVEQFGLPSGLPWASETSGIFAVEIDGRWIDSRTPGLAVREVTEAEEPPGARHITVHLTDEADEIAIEHHTITYAGTALLETWIVVWNTSAQPARITRLDSLVLDLPADNYELLSFNSAWGMEFEPERAPLRGPTVLESRAGRSSKGCHPWFALFRDGRATLSAAVAWSGNWVFRFEPLHGGAERLSGGLHDWEFYTDLAPGESATTPPVVLVLAEGTNLNAISVQYAHVGRQHWYPRNALVQTLPVEWNHWFSYEDQAITEAVFQENVDVAARLGIEVCTLDAGWFGPSDPSTHWYDYRGDWDLVNTARFPSGIRALSDYVHEHGMAFGLWCEIEGLGKRARLAETRPDLVATRGGKHLGYVCLGSTAGQAWAFEVLDRLITEYCCDWVKLDFNLDPGAGCDRTDHDHGAGDGLFVHYQGYYRLLERLRERHPNVILENCSSGGLRIDLGIMRRTHMAFLSDPDWPEHSLQVFWGVSTVLAPDVCLHWGYCEWLPGNHPHQNFNPRDPNLQPHQLDYYTRISMLRLFGFSQRLPDLPAWVAERFAHHIEVYKTQVRRFIKAADLYRLTGQPLREGRGDRWAGFQYRMPDGSEHLLFVFRLPRGEPTRTLRLAELEPEWAYTVTWLGERRQERLNGAVLMDAGLTFEDLPEEGSVLLHMRGTA